MYKPLSILWVLLSFGSLSHAQSKIDSLQQVLATVADDSLKIRTYLHLRGEYHRTNPQIALEYTIKAVELAKKAKLQTSLGEAIYRKGTVLFSLRRYQEAEEAFKKALFIFSTLGDKKSSVAVIIVLAKLYQDQSKIEEALNLYLEALPITKDVGDKNAEARIYNFLGGLYKVQKQYDKAIENYQLALSIVKELNFTPGISACLANLAAIYDLLGRYDLAISYNKQALKLKYENNDKLGASRVLNNLGIVSNNLGQYDVAENYFHQAHLLAKEFGDAKLIASIEYGLSVSAFHRGHFYQSIEVSEKVLASLDSLPDLDLATKVYHRLSHAYKEIGAFEKAYTNAIIANSLSDSLYSEKTLLVINDIEAKYQNEQKTKEIALLESENRLQEVQIQKRKNERNYLIAFGIVALILMGMVYNQYLIKQKANAKLKELDQLKSDFFANISHEFRTPLSLIMAPLKEKIETSTSEKERNEYDMMYRNADRLFNLIDQLLDLSKLESGKMSLEKSSIEISHFFKIIEASFSSLAVHKQIAFEADIPKEGVWLEFDQDIIQKVCYNLLSNAFKFTPEDGTVGFVVSVDNDWLKIVVSDSGVGITKEDQANIFDRFFQSSSSHEVGSGIGLALTKELVEFHQGKIMLDSTASDGSIFSVHIPVSSTHTSEYENVKAQPASLPPAPKKSAFHTPESLINGAHPAILIIEDNEDMRNYLSELLLHSYTIHTSPNGVDGIAVAKEIIPDLIISDVMMPKKDGMEVCNELKSAKETDHIPIILLTARADQESKLRGLTTGADNYLLKPFDPSELKVRVANLLEQRSKLKEKYTKLMLLAPDEIEISNAEESFLKTVMEVVNNHIQNSEFSVEQFCSETGMSRMQLHRKLTALTGYSATAFVRHQRLVRATQLLIAGEPVSQVAYATGFGSLSYFTRAFKEEFGVVPSEYVSAKV